ncbi:hypothetical protein AMECASPLE_037922 [Ameca splendens]|uniref:Uncharacterized protein n=1 Tax=Ameca splendens TaxID=208324 RepID=A0ABV0XL40_9TELE
MRPQDCGPTPQNCGSKNIKTHKIQKQRERSSEAAIVGAIREQQSVHVTCSPDSALVGRQEQGPNNQTRRKRRKNSESGTAQRAADWSWITGN